MNKKRRDLWRRLAIEEGKKHGRKRVKQDPLERLFRWVMFLILPKKLAVAILKEFKIKPS